MSGRGNDFGGDVRAYTLLYSTSATHEARGDQQGFLNWAANVALCGCVPAHGLYSGQSVCIQERIDR